MDTWVSVFFEILRDNLFSLELALGLYLVFGVFEYLYPAERGHTVFGRLQNIGFAILLILGGTTLVSFIVFAIPAPSRIVPTTSIVHSAAFVSLYFLVTDFIYYWYHRIQHQSTILWFIHKLHHSDTALNVTTSMRTYWLELPVQTLVIALPARFLLPLDVAAFGVIPILFTLWLLFAHSNINLHLGRLTPVISGPQLHRTHHSREQRHYGKNFAQFFPVFDILFGTYYKPQAGEFPSTGISDHALRVPVTNVLVRPFSLWLKAKWGRH